MALLRFRKIIKKSHAGNFRDSGSAMLWLKNVLNVRFRTIGLQTPQDENIDVRLHLLEYVHGYPIYS